VKRASSTCIKMITRWCFIPRIFRMSGNLHKISFYFHIVKCYVVFPLATMVASQLWQRPTAIRVMRARNFCVKMLCWILSRRFHALTTNSLKYIENYLHFHERIRAPQSNWVIRRFHIHYRAISNGASQMGIFCKVTNRCNNKPALSHARNSTLRGWWKIKWCLATLVASGK